MKKIKRTIHDVIYTDDWFMFFALIVAPIMAAIPFIVKALTISVHFLNYIIWGMEF